MGCRGRGEGAITLCITFENACKSYRLALFDQPVLDHSSSRFEACACPQRAKRARLREAVP